MNRNEVTTVNKLSIGDVFYKLKDSKKTVLQLVNYPRKQTHFRTYRFFCIQQRFAAWIGDDKQRLDQEVKPINGDTAVVFLRSTKTNENDSKEVNHAAIQG